MFIWPKKNKKTKEEHKARQEYKMAPKETRELEFFEKYWKTWKQSDSTTIDDQPFACAINIPWSTAVASPSTGFGDPNTS